MEKYLEELNSISAIELTIANVESGLEVDVNNGRITGAKIVPDDHDFQSIDKEYDIEEKEC